MRRNYSLTNLTRFPPVSGRANVGWASGPQRLDVFQLRARGLFVEKIIVLKA